MNKQKLALKVVEKMMADDAFSQWLGIEVEDIKPGYAKLQMKAREDMANGFKVSHGGIAFSLADSALAFASNSYGRVALALENNISYMKKVMPGDTLTAVTEELSLGRRIAVYNIKITTRTTIRLHCSVELFSERKTIISKILTDSRNTQDFKLFLNLCLKLISLTRFERPLESTEERYLLFGLMILQHCRSKKS